MQKGEPHAASGLQDDAWLSAVCGYPCFRAAGDLARNPASAIAGALAALNGNGRAFAYAKLSTREVAACTRLVRSGFAVVDTAITLEWQRAADLPEWDAGQTSVSCAGPGDAEAVGSIAATCFKVSRFHLDPLFPDSLAGKIKREWSINSCRGLRGAGVYVARIDGRIVGFLAVVLAGSEGAQTAVIDLIGVAPDHQGRGIGRGLVAAFIAEWSLLSKRLQVGTQAANIASLRFYEACGFRICQSNFVLHAHVQNGEVLC